MIKSYKVEVGKFWVPLAHLDDIFITELLAAAHIQKPKAIVRYTFTPNRLT